MCAHLGKDFSCGEALVAGRREKESCGLGGQEGGRGRGDVQQAVSTKKLSGGGKLR